MNWEDLIAAARRLATPDGNRQPTQAALKRAVSTAYYAMFHTLAHSNAECLAGPRNQNNEPAWVHVYRAIDHQPAKNRMNENKRQLPPQIRRFADTFSELQSQRHLADYAPDKDFTTSETDTWILRAEAAIIQFNQATPDERKQLAIKLLIRTR